MSLPEIRSHLRAPAWLARLRELDAECPTRASGEIDPDDRPGRAAVDPASERIARTFPRL
jgi:hypothetical protein